MYFQSSGIDSNKKWLLFIPVLLVYIIGMFVDIMEPDAAQYASMSLSMLDSGNYLQLYYRGEDYIDKPPLIFWTAALSFKLLGVSNFAYKFPSVLFTLLGLWATYKLGKLVYNERTGFYSALILGSCQAWFMINQDVRTDTILAACTVLAIWQLAAFNRDGKNFHILWASLGIAGAMLTKGPIGIMVPALAVATDLAMKRLWSKVFQWQWLLIVVIVIICLAPMLWGLYWQFDATEGKQTYNGWISSGLRFYFWTQSFGRLTGESTWKNNSDIFFFVHTSLWAFLPWSLLFVVAFAKRIINLVKQQFLLRENEEGLTIGGILFPFIAFSLSHYKLPHYIFVYFPLMTLVTAQFVTSWADDSHKTWKLLSVVQTSLCVSLVVIACFFGFITFPPTAFTIVAVFAGFLGVGYFIVRGQTLFQRVVLSSFVAIVLVNLIMNGHFYPGLMNYQTESKVGRWVREEKLPFVFLGNESFALDFYYRQNVPRINSIEELKHSYAGQSLWVFANQKAADELRKSGVMIITEQILDDFPSTRLHARFLLPDTRSEKLVQNYMFKIKV